MEPPDIEPLSCILALFLPLSIEVILGLIAAAILLACSAFISGSEVAFFSLGPADKEDLETDKSTTARRILALLAKPQRLLATILIANNFANIGIVILSSFIISNSFNFEEFPYWVSFLTQVVAVTFLLLLIGEVLPKVYATTNSAFLRRFMALPIEILFKVFTPLSSVLISGTNVINRRMKTRSSDYSVDELEHALELTRDEATNPDEEKILRGIVRFGGTDVKQIMTPRTEVLAFESQKPFRDVLTELLDRGYSRVPIYRDSLDQVIGVLYLKDLLPYADEQNLYWQNLLRPSYFVPENKKLDDLLKEFQERKVHLAIVVDEYGGTSGIVSLEDILEEIVGEITDEFDDEDIYYSKLDDSNYIFEGRTPLVDFYKILDIDGQEWEDAKGESDTLAGFVLEMSGKIPLKNEKVKFHNYTITVEAADRRKVKRVKLTIDEPAAEERNRL